MSGYLVIEAPGLSTTIQDSGRYGYQDIGMPVSGALDPSSFHLANELVGNTPNTAALEVRMVGPQFRVEADAVRIAVTGTATPIEILDDTKPSPAWQSLRLERGQRFRIGSMHDSATSYLGIEGGFDLPPVFGSMSTYLRGQIGGFFGRALRAGDALPLQLLTVERRPEKRLSQTPLADRNSRIRVTLGPQADHFTADAVNTFLSEGYTISHQADRMGFRLDGPALEHSKGYNIVSDGIATGAIQVPGTGMPIILLADHQTSGGYPKIGVVISADLPRLAAMIPGTIVRFQEVSVEEAEDIRRHQTRQLMSYLSRIEAARAGDQLDSESLLAVSLISGVTAGED